MKVKSMALEQVTKPLCFKLHEHWITGSKVAINWTSAKRLGHRRSWDNSFEGPYLRGNVIKLFYLNQSCMHILDKEQCRMLACVQIHTHSMEIS